MDIYWGVEGGETCLFYFLQVPTPILSMEMSSKQVQSHSHPFYSLLLFMPHAFSQIHVALGTRHTFLKSLIHTCIQFSSFFWASLGSVDTILNESCIILPWPPVIETFLLGKAECGVFHYSNSSMWGQVKGSPRYYSTDVTCTAKPVLNAAWQETRTAPGMDTHAHDTSLHPRGTLDYENSLCWVSYYVALQQL